MSENIQAASESGVGLSALLGCDCQTFARTGHEHGLFLNHHPMCHRYSPEADCRELIINLIRGIEGWASDEDGVHPDCWDAYERAKLALGEPLKLGESPMC